MSLDWECVCATGLQHLWPRTAFIYVPLQPEFGLLQLASLCLPSQLHPGTFPRSTPALHDTCMEARAVPALTPRTLYVPCSINSHLPCGLCYWQTVLQTEAGLAKEPEKKEINTRFGTLGNAGI